MLKLYAHPASPYSLKVQLFLEEIGQPYTYEFIDLEKRQHLKSPFKEINPLMRVPTLDFHGFILAESNVILRYLANRFELYQWYPHNLEDRANVEKWMDYCGFQVGVLVNNLVWERYWTPIFKVPSSQAEIEKSLKKLAKELPIIEAHLQTQRYFAGANPTLADITFLPMLYYASFAKFSFAAYPALTEWYHTMQERPAWKRVLAKITKPHPSVS